MTGGTAHATGSDVRPSAPMSLEASRRQLLVDSLGIMVSAGGFGLVYGLRARAAGF